MSTYTEQPGLEQRQQRRIAEGPVTLAAAGARVFDIRGCRGVVIIPGAGATATYSKVDALDAEAHDAATDATTTTELLVDEWAFIRVSTAGGATRCCVI